MGNLSQKVVPSLGVVRILEGIGVNILIYFVVKVTKYFPSVHGERANPTETNQTLLYRVTGLKCSVSVPDYRGSYSSLEVWIEFPERDTRLVVFDGE